jgi:hypothetical protein
MNSASLCSLAGRYDNPLPLRFLAPIASLKIPAQELKSNNFPCLNLEPFIMKYVASILPSAALMMFPGPDFYGPP